MAFEKKPEPKPDKWEVIYEDDECIQIWRYNSKKTTFGPVDVETKWKKQFNPWEKKKKTLGDLAKEDKNKKTK
jgi:hypothetical protein